MRADGVVNLPKGWVMEKLEESVEKVVYTNKIMRRKFLDIGEYPIISQEHNLINGYWNSSKELFKIKKPVVIFGDHTKIIKYIDFNFVLGADGVKILQPTDRINSKYFYYYLFNVNLKDLGYARHYRLLKEIYVKYPKSIEEQKRIVSKLDALFAEIEALETKTKQNLENTKELFQSYLEGVFENKGDDWEEKKLGEVCEIRTGKLNANAMVENGKYPFFTCSREVYSINNFAFDCNAVLLAGNNASGDFNVKIYSGKFNAYQRTYTIRNRWFAMDFRGKDFREIPCSR